MSPYGRVSSDKLSGRPSTKDLEVTEVLEAVLFRESHTVPGTVKERRAAVFPYVLSGHSCADIEREVPGIQADTACRDTP